MNNSASDTGATVIVDLAPVVAVRQGRSGMFVLDDGPPDVLLINLSNDVVMIVRRTGQGPLVEVAESLVRLDPDVAYVEVEIRPSTHLP